MSGSTQRSRPVSTAAVVTHGRVDVDEAVGRVSEIASRVGVVLVDDPREAEIVVALGGDGTMLRTLAQLLGSNVPVIGVNFGRVGFLASIRPDDLERNLERVFAGEFVVVELSTLEVRLDGARHVAVNDVVATSSTLGRMVELAWAVGGEDLGTVPCDGMICSTPSGSTAYNLSNGGPVLVRGLDAMAVTFIAPHSLEARPLVVPRGLDVTIRNATQDVSVALLVDGHHVSEIAPGAEAAVTLCNQRSLLATLPETDEAGEQPDGQMFVADITEVVITRLNAEATKLVVEWWTPTQGLRKIERE
jgi:NAD+ kinase